jgi:hypothetical protein
LNRRVFDVLVCQNQSLISPTERQVQQSTTPEDLIFTSEHFHSLLDSLL